MKRTVVIRLELPSQRFLKILLKALSPETKKPVTSRSKVSIEGEKKTLVIRIEAKDTSALRATMNSYLRWVTLVKDTYEVAANIEKASNM